MKTILSSLTFLLLMTSVSHAESLHCQGKLIDVTFYITQSLEMPVVAAKGEVLIGSYKAKISAVTYKHSSLARFFAEKGLVGTDDYSLSVETLKAENTYLFNYQTDMSSTKGLMNCTYEK